MDVVDGASIDAAAPLVRTLSLRLTPDDPGSVRVMVRFHVPDRVTEVRVVLPDDATVASTRGFSRIDGREYAWDGTTERPSMTSDNPANVTGEAPTAERPPAHANPPTKSLRCI